MNRETMVAQKNKGKKRTDELEVSEWGIDIVHSLPQPQAMPCKFLDAKDPD